ncbi:glycosyltransferase involved in cell wall biosynthesis [Dysgonomonadaceae bacterium PH5-43]|nr:glycosyltransferase involved in cell wall biosynthesis [Dysgonomonadaceae bacterium PH5-43]
MRRKKTVCIDVNSVVPLFVRGYLSGVGRTTLELVQALAEMKDELPFNLVLYTQNIKGVTSKKFDLPFENKHIYLRDRSPYNEWVAKLRLKEMLFKYDLLHIPHNFGYVAKPEKTVLTLHDAMFFSYQESFLGHDSDRINCTKLGKSCKAIVTCSHSSKQDIVKYIGVPEDKVTVIHWGISKDNFFPETEENIKNVELKYVLKRPYFVMASCDIGRKNTELLMENFHNYVEQGGSYDLVLVWHKCPEAIKVRFEKEIKEGRIHLLGGISDNELRTLYSGAIASFFPSKYEGFGLPILESMACGTPVVTCRNSSLEEVGGDVAFYVSEDSNTEMADFMFDFEKGKYNQSELKAKALDRAGLFTWRKAAEKYVEFYMKQLNGE